MAIKRFAGDKWSGLSTDTKPTNATTGGTFYETDTASVFVYDGTAWTQASGAALSIFQLSNVNGDPNFDAVPFWDDSAGVVVWYNAANLADFVEGSLQITESQITDLGNYALDSHTHPASDIVSGTFADARVAQSNVTQHEAALTITESQISDLGSYLLNITGESIGDLSDVAATPGAFDRVPYWNGTASQQISWFTIAAFADEIQSDLQITESQITDLGSYALDTHTHPASDIVSGTFADARIAVSNVTQHQSALTITESQISDLGDYIPSSEKGSNNGVATLDGSGKIPTSQMPALALTEVHVVADIAARNAISPVQEGDVAIVTDASADAAVDSGGATYIYDGAAWQLLKDPTDVSLTAPAANRIPYGDGAGDLASEAALEYDPATNQLQITGSIRLDEGGTISTPARGEATFYTETEVISTDTVTRVMMRLSNGDDVIFASFIEPT